MNFLISFITSFCVAAVFIGCLYIICPNGNISKSVKYLLSLLFMVIVISCGTLNAVDYSFDFSLPPIVADTSEDMQIASAHYIYSYVLRANKINFTAITVCTDKLSDDSIVISKVIIYTDCESAEVLKALGELAESREVEIINE